MMSKSNIEDWYAMNNNQVVKRIGRQLKQMRLNKNITQKDAADVAGLNRTTISELENGRPATILTLVQILRAYEKLELLDIFSTGSDISPMEYMAIKGKKRKRASAKKKSDSKESEW